MKKIIFCLIIGITISCKTDNTQKKIITIKNPLNIERSFETVTLKNIDLDINDFSNYGIKNIKTDKIMISQTVDNKGDGIYNVLLFQPHIKPNSSEQYEVFKLDNINVISVSDTICYSRFVPERTDDYAWENDKVAFRTFGPTAERMFENNIEGGTLTSGIDCWLKRVNYPIINKWYKKYTYGSGTYHEDTGEGLDNFHVGFSRGCGGIAVNKNGHYYVSKNFTTYKTITNGPIRTSFILTYNDWDANGKAIKESKLITLDRGNNLSKFEVTITTDTISVGLTLHDKTGISKISKKNTWMSYWESLDDSELGTGIVADPNEFISVNKYITDELDLSNLYMSLKPKNNTFTYYAGFGWKKSGQFENEEEWNNYLNEFSLRLKNPLLISLN